jgi:acyl-CoA synthetase (AMP-forming)/AMP-acid ligase II
MVMHTCNPRLHPQQLIYIINHAEDRVVLFDASFAPIVKAIAAELNVNASQVAATVTLLDEGSTVPFIARYRKEVTGNLDDTQLRTLEERLIYLRELEDRRAAIIAGSFASCTIPVAPENSVGRRL